MDATLDDEQTHKEDEASLREQLKIAKEGLEKREAETQQAVAREKGRSFLYIYSSTLYKRWSNTLLVD